MTANSSPPSRATVCRSARSEPARRHGDQELVSDAVAERAVHLFELIEIEHGERDTGAVNGRIGEHLGELVVQGRAVRERREWIAIGERFEPPAGLHDLADVLGQNGDVVPRQRCDPDRYVQFDPVATLQIQRFDERRALVLHGVGDDLDESGVVVAPPPVERAGSGVDEALTDRAGHGARAERFNRRVLGPHDEGRRIAGNDELGRIMTPSGNESMNCTYCSANRLAATASETSRQTPLVWVTSPRSFFTTLTMSSIQRYVPLSVRMR